MFRDNETQTLVARAQAGESALVIGASGMGKSNLFNHLMKLDVQEHYLGEEATNYIFVRVNWHFAADFSTRSLYSLIIEQLEQHPHLQPEQNTILDYHEKLLNAQGDALKVQRYFKLAIRTAMRPPRRKLVLLFDQFIDVYRHADGLFFANLRGLREDYKYRLSYFVFTRHTLEDVIAQDGGREEFYELLSDQLLGLPPYNQVDSQNAAVRIAKRRGKSLDEEVAQTIYGISGGHGGLLRMSYSLFEQDKLPLVNKGKKLPSKLLADHGLNVELQKLWQSLDVEEQKYLLYLVHDSQSLTALDVQSDTLMIKGILRVNGRKTPEIFSPLLTLFIQETQTIYDRVVTYDEKTNVLEICGKPIELKGKELELFQILHDNLGYVVNRERLIKTLWPRDNYEAANSNLNTTKKRLRDKLQPDHIPQDIIATEHGRGYKLLDM